MKKYIVLDVEIETVRYPGQAVVEVRLLPSAVQDFTLGLCLLKEELIEGLVIAGRSGVEFKVVRLNESSVCFATVASDIVLVELTGNSLDFLQHFFLKYYRDGIAEVDHVDLEALGRTAEQKSMYITFKVPESRPPLSPAEAERWLGGL